MKRSHAGASTHGQSTMKSVAPAHSLTVGEGFVDPLGFHQALPTYSWKLPFGVERQTAYRIECVSGERKWDSGWVQSDQATFVPHGGHPFVSRARATWRVNYRDEAGHEAGWSAPASFELGLLSTRDWKAQWIRPAAEVDLNSEPVGVLRRAFSIARETVRARVYVTARGLFELRLNGRRVGRDCFANGFTSYTKRLDTLTYDVTGLLQSGDNTFEGLLAPGWYAGRFPFETKHVGPYGQDAALLAQLEITYADGTMDTVVTDDKWEGTFDGQIISSSIYDGEVYDARRQPGNWGRVLAQSDLGPAALMPKPFQPVRETAVLEPQAVTEPQPGRFVFDLGQNMVGRARIKVPVDKDRTVTIRFAEMIHKDGTLYTENYRTAKSTDTYTAAETGVVEWEPRFTFHGFRYVEISGASKDVAAATDWVTGMVLHTDFPTTGSFASSHEKLNRLQSNIVWGWLGNSVDIPTDCPQRDERMGWTGDAQVFAATSLFNTGAHAFWKSWLGSMRDDQYEDGGVPAFIPTTMSKWEARSPGWSDAATIIPWDLYARTGDEGVLAENYDMMERLVAWYRSKSVNGLLPDIDGIGDWLQPYQVTPPTPGDNMSDRKGDTPRPLLGAAFYARSARILADASRVLGRSDDAKRYGAEADSICAAFTKHYFDESGKLRNAPETQTAYVLAIAFDLIPDKLKHSAGENLVRLVREAGGHLRTGFLGTPFIATALDQTGHADVALELLFRETYPSWFYPINQGATTMWERWNSYTHENGFGDVSMNSFNHYAYGAIGQWMYERLAGLAPDPAHPGYKHFFVRPLFAPQLDSASAELETPYGKASSSWQRRGGEIELRVVVPPNTTATLDCARPDQTSAMAAGEHIVVIRNPSGLERVRCLR